MSDIKKTLKQEFLDKDYAHAYMEQFLIDRIANQIHVLRKQRGLSQEQLSDISGIAQETISKLESANFNSITMKTLYKLSKAFDVNVSVKFDSFTNAINDVVGLSVESLKVKSRFDDLSPVNIRDYFSGVKLSHAKAQSAGTNTNTSFTESGYSQAA